MSRYGAGVNYNSSNNYGADAATEAGAVMWFVMFDWNNDGRWDGVNESNRLVDCKIERGRKSYLKSVGGGFEHVRPGRATLRLDNYDRRYDPRYATSPLYPNVKPGRRVYVGVVDLSANVTYTLFVGKIDDIVPLNEPGGGEVLIECVDYMAQLNDQLLSFDAAGQNMTLTSAYQQLLADAQYPGSVVIDTDSQPVIVFGVTEKNAGQVAHELADAGMGTFFADVNGVARYYGRNHTYPSATALAQTQYKNDPVVSQPWSEVYNHVTAIAARPIKEQASVIYFLPGPVQLVANTPLVLTVDYKPAFDVQIGDYEIWSTKEGTGTEYTIETPVFYDTLTDSDATAITSHTPDLDTAAAGWTSYVGVWTIVSNKANVTGAGYNHIATNCGKSDVILTVDCTAGQNVGIMFRVSASERGWAVQKGSTLELIEFDGSPSVKATAGAGLTNVADTLIVKVVGTTVEAWYGGYKLFYTGATYNQTATRHGMYALSASTSSMDNFTITSVSDVTITNSLGYNGGTITFLTTFNAWLTKMELRGRSWGVVEEKYVSTDATSLAAYGMRRFVLDTPYLQDPNYANNHAGVIKTFAKDDREAVTVQIEAREDLQFGFDLMTPVALTSTTLDLSATYYVMGLEHEWRKGAQGVITTLNLSKIIADSTSVTAAQILSEPAQAPLGYKNPAGDSTTTTKYEEGQDTGTALSYIQVSAATISTDGNGFIEWPANPSEDLESFYNMDVPFYQVPTGMFNTTTGGTNIELVQGGLWFLDLWVTGGTGGDNADVRAEIVLFDSTGIEPISTSGTPQIDLNSSDAGGIVISYLTAHATVIFSVAGGQIVKCRAAYTTGTAYASFRAFRIK